MKKLTKILLCVTLSLILSISVVTALNKILKAYGKTYQNANEINANISINYGSYKVYRNGNLITDNTFIINDELRVYPGNEPVSNLYLFDIRELKFNQVNYYYNAENPNKNLPFIPVMDDEDNISYYSRIITHADLELNNTLNLYLVFDRYCNVTVIDTQKPKNNQLAVTYHWAVDGEFNFKTPTSSNGAEIARGSSNDKVLIGYARTDVGYKNENGNFIQTRNDYLVANYKTLGSLINHSSRGLGKKYYLNNEISDCKTVASIVPGVVFETVYIKIHIDLELKLPSSYHKTYSGLRFVVKFDKNDINNYNKYQFSNEFNNPFINIHNYITTQNELEKGGSGILYDKIGAIHWSQAEGSNETTLNKLGLINATNKTAIEMEGKAGYVYQVFSRNEDVWNVAYASENYYAYVITVKNLQIDSAENEYVFMPVASVKEVGLVETVTIVNAVKISPREVALKKLNEILSTTVLNQTYYKFKDQNGKIYYSTYSKEDANWLSNIAGDGRNFL